MPKSRSKYPNNKRNERHRTNNSLIFLLDPRLNRMFPSESKGQKTYNVTLNKFLTMIKYNLAAASNLRQLLRDTRTCYIALREVINIFLLSIPS